MDSYKGWAQLRPLNEEENSISVSFLFPLHVENRYTISSRTTGDVSLLISEIETDEPTVRLPIEAILVVNQKGEVFVERPIGPNAPISINGGIPIVQGAVSVSPLAYGCTISFGSEQYLFSQSKGTFENESLEKMNVINRCTVCKRSRDFHVHILTCGHNICNACRFLIISKKPPVVRHTYGLRPRGSISADGRQIPGVQALVQLGAAMVDANIQVHCNECQTRITGSAASSSILSVTANQTAKAIAELNDVNERRPICDNCQNRRGLIGARDYNLCRDCDQMLCAPCILQWHRNHKLKSRLERLRDLDEVELKLNDMKTTLTGVERLYKESFSDEDNQKIIKIDGHPRLGSNEMAESIHSLAQKVMQCRQQATIIQERKRALAHGWDKTSRKFGALFDRYAKEARELRKYIDRVRNFEASLSISSSGDETTTTTTTASTSPTSTSSTSSAND